MGSKPTKSLPPPVWVDTPQALGDMLSHLREAPLIAVDTESNSFYAYQERVCLIQFSAPDQAGQTVDYLVDPLALDDLSGLGELFANPEVEKVFHAAEYDVMVLRRDYGFQLRNIFDTMWAARILGWPRYGLAAILEEHFGVHTDKSLQRANWGHRPLSPQELHYARLDTHYLLPLREIQMAELTREGRLEEAKEIFAQVTRAVWSRRPFDPEGFWRLREAEELSGRELAVLRELYLYREEQARRRNLAPFRVLSDATLVHLARRQPTSREALRRGRGITPTVVRRDGRGILRAIARGRRAPVPRSPRPIRNHHLDDAVLNRYEALRAWRRERAAARGVEPDVIMSNQVLMALARRAPRTMDELAEVEELGPWRRRTYGEEILRVLNT